MEAELATLKSKKHTDLWLEDLKSFEKEYEKNK